jgi:type I restriction enzyme, S subunit
MFSIEFGEFSKQEQLTNKGDWTLMTATMLDTAQKSISQQIIRGYDMVLQDKMILDVFRVNMKPLLDQIKCLRAMNHHLSKARDLILPRLMNGEIDL